jgi:hypothetical protein
MSQNLTPVPSFRMGALNNNAASLRFAVGGKFGASRPTVSLFQSTPFECRISCLQAISGQWLDPWGDRERVQGRGFQHSSHLAKNVGSIP